jgi:hypothetical protein
VNRAAILAVPALVAGLTGWTVGHGQGPCGRGWYEREVRIEHSRLEADPRPWLSPVVVANAWPEDNGGQLDRRYVVARACVRPVTDAERNSEPYTDAGR